MGADAGVRGSAGLPGLSGFVGEFLSLVGAFDGAPYLWGAQLVTAVSATGVILGAVYLLYMFQKVMFGPLSNEKNRHLPDLNAREIAVFVPLLVGIFALGIYPRPVLAKMEQAVNKFSGFYKAKLQEAQDAPGDRNVVRMLGLYQSNAPTPPAAPGGEVNP